MSTVEGFEDQVITMLREVSGRQDTQGQLITDLREEMRTAITDMRQSLARSAPMSALDRLDGLFTARVSVLENRVQAIEREDTARNERDRWFFRIVALVIVVIVVLLLVGAASLAIYLSLRIDPVTIVTPALRRGVTIVTGLHL